jgi:hypothetical protein
MTCSNFETIMISLSIHLPSEYSCFSILNASVQFIYLGNVYQQFDTETIAPVFPVVLALVLPHPHVLLLLLIRMVSLLTPPSPDSCSADATPAIQYHLSNSSKLFSLMNASLTYPKLSCSINDIVCVRAM